MNFKPTKIKTVTTIILGALLKIFTGVYCSDCTSKMILEQNLYYYLTILAIMVGIYVIWSLFEKKK
jgi:hypothetical protein